MFYRYRGSDFSGEDYSDDFAGLASGDDPRCGTRAGYEAHRTAGEERCQSCKRGNALYMQAYRILNPEPPRKRPRRGFPPRP